MLLLFFLAWEELRVDSYSFIGIHTLSYGIREEAFVFHVSFGPYATSIGIKVKASR